MTPLIIGHRGASAVAPENTLAAFELAMRQGADGIEFDVRLSADGVPVVIHDAALSRTGSIKGLVAKLPAAELQRIDVGSWFDRRRGGQIEAEFSNEKLPSLQQVIDLFSDRHGLLYLEMKSNEDRLAAQVALAIQQCSISERIIVSSFNIPSIKQVKRINPGIRTAALFEPRVSRPLNLVNRMKLVNIARTSGADEIALHHSLAGNRVVEKARRSQLDVVIWTVDHPQWINRARALGIKALITNDPAAMIRYRNRANKHPATV